MMNKEISDLHPNQNTNITNIYKEIGEELEKLTELIEEFTRAIFE